MDAKGLLIGLSRYLERIPAANVSVIRLFNNEVVSRIEKDMTMAFMKHLRMLWQVIDVIRSAYRGQNSRKLLQKNVFCAKSGAGIP